MALSLHEVSVAADEEVSVTGTNGPINRRTVAILVSVLAVLLIGVGGLAWFMFFRAKTTFFCEAKLMNRCIAASKCPEKLRGFGCESRDTAVCFDDAQMRRAFFLGSADGPRVCFPDRSACERGIRDEESRQDDLDRRSAEAAFYSGKERTSHRKYMGTNVGNCLDMTPDIANAPVPPE